MSLNATKARASVQSGLRYLARFSGRGLTGSGGDTKGLGGFFELPPLKKLRRPPFDAGGGSCTGGGGGGSRVVALNCAAMWGSRRTLMVSVNSSLLCSMLKNIALSKSYVVGQIQKTYSSNS